MAVTQLTGQSNLALLRVVTKRAASHKADMCGYQPASTQKIAAKIQGKRGEGRAARRALAQTAAHAETRWVFFFISIILF